MRRRDLKRRLCLMTISGLVWASGASAQGAAAERISRECNRVYVSLCKDIKQGPEMLGQCFKRHPSIADKIPARCTEDFQLNIENYNDAMGGN